MNGTAPGMTFTMEYGLGIIPAEGNPDIFRLEIGEGGPMVQEVRIRWPGINPACQVFPDDPEKIVPGIRSKRFDDPIRFHARIFSRSTVDGLMINRPIV